MPTISLPSKYLQDESQSKFAPITTPDAVRFPNGDTLNDRLDGWATIPAPTSSDEGKVITVDNNGDYTLGTGGGGGSLPSQTGHAGEYLTTDGTDASWNPVCRINLYN